MKGSLRRGAVVFAVRAGTVVELTVLDRGPDGWWCKAEGDRDAEQIKSSQLFTTRLEARQAGQR